MSDRSVPGVAAGGGAARATCDTGAPEASTRLSGVEPAVATTPAIEMTASEGSPARRRRWPSWALLAVIGTGILGAGLWAGGTRSWLGVRRDLGELYTVEPVTFSITLTEDGEVKPRKSIELKCEVEGQSTILSIVPESTKVKKGDLLVELSSDVIEDKISNEQLQIDALKNELEAARQEVELQRQQNASDIKKAEIDVEIAKLELEKYRKGDYPQRRRQIEIDIQQTELEINRKNDELEKYQKLFEKKYITRAKLEQIQFELQKLNMVLGQHELALRILDDYEKPKNEKQRQSAYERAVEELDRTKQRAKNRLAKAEAVVQQKQQLLERHNKRLAKLRDQLAKCKIHAPVDGIVQYPTNGWYFRSEGGLAPGERVMEGQTLLVLPDTSQLMVEVRVHEADRHLIHEGMPCVIRVPAVPGKTFTGKIAKIATFADTANRWLNPELKEHTTDILLDPTDAPLSPGDSAEVEILVDTVEGALAVPVQAVYTRGRRSFVFVERDGDAEPVEVRLGRSNATLVEVLEGLEAGQRVLLHADKRLLAKLPTSQTTEPSAFRKPPRRPKAARKPTRNSRG